MKTNVRMKLLLFWLILLISATGAVQGQPALHGIYSEKLRTIMLRMNQLVYEREMTALQVQEERKRHLKELINTVSDLVKAASVLTDAVPGIELKREDQVIFRALANQLYKEAREMGTMVEEKDYSDLDPAYQRLNETCNACHSLFRF